ncbi:CpsD/CapB family tyrosine-protein kinase [Ornithinimicrobium sp. W1665]|uniref:CpsD/CapB family tyrosine-protein kinase n=1 Tax=Ornithinimicrobium sp. W1665 TaxID=3416666 RepID=UPI003D6BBD6B
MLVIDADLRRPTVAEKLGLEGAAGLTSVLSGEAQLDDVLQRWGDSQMYVLSGGEVPPNPSELLGSKAMENLFYRLLRDFDFVLVDSPPVLPVTDALVMSRLTGGVLVVVSTATRRRHLQEALKTLRTSDVRLDGFVLTKTAHDKSGSYYQYYGSRRQSVQAESEHPPRSRQQARSRRRAGART